MCTILNDKGPTHNLRTYIEELCHDSLTVMMNGENTFQSRPEIDAVGLVTILGILVKRIMRNITKMTIPIVK